MVTFADLKGKTLTKVVRVLDDELFFHTTEGEVYRLYHMQSCCECVGIEDICGDLEDLVGSPILVAEEVSCGALSELPTVAFVRLRLQGVDASAGRNESETWTFYKLDTAKGGVTIRWYGSSNGYYSESVDFELV